jgi:hypothetical protein
MANVCTDIECPVSGSQNGFEEGIFLFVVMKRYRLICWWK